MRAAEVAGLSRRSMLTALLSLSAAACSKMAFLAVNLPASFGSYKRHADIAYGSDPRQRLDVYVPEGVAAVARPVLVFWYGGRWEDGDKNDYRFVGDALAGLGYVVVMPNYRHYPQVKMAGFMSDAAQATLWAAAHAREHGADPARLYLMGHSAGAHIAALLSLDRSYLAAAAGAPPAIAGVIGLSGPYDFLPLEEADLQDMFGPPERYEQSQPIHFARPDAAPMLLVHGLADKTVWPKNTVNLAAALRGLGAPVTVKLYSKASHADTVAALSRTVRGRAPTLTDIDAWVNPSPSS